MAWITTVLLWSILAFIVVVIVFFISFYVRNLVFKKRCTSNARLNGKIVIVTGASAGIGKEAAKDFARRGAKVILACRNRTKAEGVADHIIETTGNKNVHVRLLDTSLMASVRAFAKDVLEKENRLDVLCLNAGIVGDHNKMLTVEGLETTMATNHFGHFLLVNLLSELLQKTKPSRVVVTSSQGHLYVSKVNPKDLNYKTEKYGAFRAYALSKLCNVMMTKYLAVQLRDKGVTINCLCPGFVDTEIFEKSSAFFIRFPSWLVPLLARTAEEGAQTIIHLAVSEDVTSVSGALFVDCKESPFNPLAADAGLVKKVWEASEDAVRLTQQERWDREVKH